MDNVEQQLFHIETVLFTGDYYLLRLLKTA